METSRWSSLGEVARDLDFEHLGGNVDALRSEIRRQLSSAHPDKTGGSFADKGAETRYLLLSEALAFVDQNQATSLVRLDELPGLVAAIRQAMDMSPKQELSQARADYRAAAGLDTRTRYGSMRVTSGTFAAICGAIVAFAGQLNDNPVFGHLVTTPFALGALGIGFLYSGMFFTMAWFLERRAEQRSEWLATEDGQREMLASALRRSANQTATCQTITLRSLVNAVSRHGHGSPMLRLFAGTLSHATAEKLVRANLVELEQRGIVKKAKQNGFEIAYEVDPIVVRELLEERRTEGA